MKPIDDHIKDEFGGNTAAAARYYGKERNNFKRTVRSGDFYAVKVGAHWQLFKFMMAAEDLEQCE